MTYQVTLSRGGTTVQADPYAAQSPQVGTSVPRRFINILYVSSETMALAAEKAAQWCKEHSNNSVIYEVFSITRLNNQEFDFIA